MSIISALYLVLLAAVAGYVLIARVPSLLHTPMLSGSNFIHGIVLAGTMLALSKATGTLELVIGFVAVTAAAANVVGGFIVTDRMLHLFEQKGVRGADTLRPAVASGESLASSSQPRKSGSPSLSRSTDKDKTSL